MASTCTICSLPNAKDCARCHSTRYCSPECQQTDWPCHRLLCSQYATHKSSSRPSPSHYRAILFSPNEDKPKLIWLECKNEDSDTGGTFEMPQYRKYLGQYQGRGAFAEHKMIQKNLLRGKNLANNLEVVCRETFLVDGSLKNQSIIKATQGGLYYDWRGPMLAFKENGKGLHTTTHLDMDMQDYRDIVDYFISYGDETVIDSDQHHNGSRKVKGVKISCQGDQITFGAEKYISVDVPRSHMVFYSGTPPISELVGFPVRVRKYPPDRLWKDSDEAGVYKNQAATFLHQETDKSSNWWGWAPMPWQNKIGSVLVVRSDGKDVTTQQVEALCEFCQFKMQPLLEHGLGAGLVKMTREEVMGYMTPARFREYFAELREKKIDDAAAWITASLPK